MYAKINLITTELNRERFIVHLYITRGQKRIFDSDDDDDDDVDYNNNDMHNTISIWSRVCTQ